MANGGPVVTFEVAGGADAATAVLDRCRLARIALSLGGPETLLTHPATIAGRYTPAERAELGVTDGLVRMSVGLEHVDDLIADLTQALEG
jgi:cystathionine beta-lyase/cystathionine gamma-synthase